MRGEITAELRFLLVIYKTSWECLRTQSGMNFSGSRSLSNTTAMNANFPLLSGTLKRKIFSQSNPTALPTQPFSWHFIFYLTVPLTFMVCQAVFGSPNTCLFQVYSNNFSFQTTSWKAINKQTRNQTKWKYPTTSKFGNPSQEKSGLLRKKTKALITVCSLKLFYNFLSFHTIIS